MNKKKIILLAITFILTIIVFTISTYLQKQLIDYEPTIECLVLNQDIMANQKISEEMFQIKEIPISIVNTILVVRKYDEIDGLYDSSSFNFFEETPYCFSQ